MAAWWNGRRIDDTEWAGVDEALDRFETAMRDYRRAMDPSERERPQNAATEANDNGEHR